jgi:hypothetical protein
VNDLGCGGYYYDGKTTGIHGEAPPFACRGSAEDIIQNQIVIRQGRTGWRTFGWAKAYYQHNLYLQPELNVITNALPQPQGNTRVRYIESHITPDGIDMQVVVVIFLPTQIFKKPVERTPDDYMVGLLTAYCVAPGDPSQTCPPWVNGPNGPPADGGAWSI